MTDGWAAAAWGAHVQLGAALLERRGGGSLPSACTAEGPGQASGCGVGGLAGLGVGIRPLARGWFMF